MKTLVVDAELAQTEDAYTAATGGAPGKYTREMSMKKAPRAAGDHRVRRVLQLRLRTRP